MASSCKNGSAFGISILFVLSIQIKLKSVIIFGVFLLSFSDFKYHNREPFDCGGHDIDVCFPTGPTQNHILLFIKFFIYLCFCLFFFTHTIFLFFLEEKRKKPKSVSYTHLTLPTKA